ncbi:hypothetical protein Q7C30_018815 [Pseudomonas sp. RAC1]|uniref:hypothetical protein n=1 Tax=Pseudomonas sp. RAC1 TaxID=3064900 RepID=UPI0027262A32|nr:hypothetical protein [Pseudomonas sp. RAC1]MDV9034147.1 hypothetical protein [Pseudomonas sp. RAC1]
MNVVSTSFNDALPSMIGFAEERIGAERCEWTSPCYLLADRDLALNEVIRVWAVDRQDGRVLKVVALKATQANRTRDQWPTALINAIRNDETQVDHSKLLHAGVIKGTTFSAGTVSHSTSKFIAASSHADCDRLWVLSSRARLYSNAPFAANQVMAHDLADIDFQAGQRLCVQVRDRTSQGLLESIVVSFEVNSAPSDRAKSLCDAVMQGSEILRAGVLADDGISIAPNDQGNALWIPQLSELSVTVNPAPWVFHGNFVASRAVAAEEELRIHIHDDVTGMPLKGSPVIFKASADQLEQDKWPAALSRTLQVSSLAEYLALELDKPNGASGHWKCAGIPLRILMSTPLEENDEWVPLVPENGLIDEPIPMKEQLFKLTQAMQSAIDQANKDNFVLPVETFTVHGATAALDRHWTLYPLEVTLHDIRTGYVCYHVCVEYSAGHIAYTETPQAFAQKLMDAMRRGGIPETVFADQTLSSNGAENTEDTSVLWLPRKLGMVATLHIQRPKQISHYGGSLQVELVAKQHYLAHFSKAQGSDRPTHIDSFGIPLPSCQNFLSGDSMIMADRRLQLKLKPESLSEGIRFLYVMPPGVLSRTRREQHPAFAKEYGYKKDSSDTLYLSPSFHTSPLASVGMVGAEFDFQSPWVDPFELNLKIAPDRIKLFRPKDTLCADRCMTLGAHVYDTGGARENGVDENTGLFHAHYPVGTLRGLGGEGPELDLTLHYSAVRANEGALGDGWAFRFSYFDNRRRVLTLSTGQTVTLTKAQMKSLSAAKTKFLDQEGYRITAVEGDENRWTSLTIQMPAGAEGRQEVLSLPISHDGKEAGAAYKAALKAKLEKIIENLTRWIEKENITSGQIANLKKQRDAWKAELADIERESLVLVTSRILSPQGGELTLAWQGIKGHVRLDSIADAGADTVLLRAKHDSIVAQGSSQSTFTVWPDTAESYDVTLDIQNCLLESITRHRAGQDSTPERYVRFNYELDPVLDQVLTGILEEDGSLETVQYESPSLERAVAPRVEMHTLVPGANQQCIAHRYEWTGEYIIERSRKWRLSRVGKSPCPFIETSWTFNNGVRVVDTIIQYQPDAPLRTTRFTYPDTAASNSYRHLALSRPVKIEVTTESPVETSIAVDLS